MPAAPRFLCPVCHREAKPTTKGNIAAHMDSIRRDTCPGGGLPWQTAVYAPPEYVNVEIGLEVSA